MRDVRADVMSLRLPQRDMLRLDALIMTVQLNIRRLLEARLHSRWFRIRQTRLLAHSLQGIACKTCAWLTVNDDKRSCTPLHRPTA